LFDSPPFLRVFKEGGPRYEENSPLPLNSEAGAVDKDVATFMTTTPLEEQLVQEGVLLPPFKAGVSPP
jgi:hypothetical protein